MRRAMYLGTLHFNDAPTRAASRQQQLILWHVAHRYSSHRSFTRRINKHYIVSQDAMVFRLLRIQIKSWINPGAPNISCHHILLRVGLTEVRKSMTYFTYIPSHVYNLHTSSSSKVPYTCSNCFPLFSHSHCMVSSHSTTRVFSSSDRKLWIAIWTLFLTFQNECCDSSIEQLLSPSKSTIVLLILVGSWALIDRFFDSKPGCREDFTPTISPSIVGY